MNFSSKLIEQAVTAFATLPGIGRKTALRLVLHLIKQDKNTTESFADALVKMRQQIKHCKECHHLSDAEVCSICSDARRDKSLIMVVETIRDVMAIEETNQYRGLYHVLGGVISPIEGISPHDLNLTSLLKRVLPTLKADGSEVASGVKELIMAIAPTIEGDTTIYYISKQLMNKKLKISTLSRGISFGGELEYADEMTLGRSIVGRVPYKNNS
jgi:recombination protein RecR